MRAGASVGEHQAHQTKQSQTQRQTNTHARTHLTRKSRAAPRTKTPNRGGGAGDRLCGNLTFLCYTIVHSPAHCSARGNPASPRTDCSAFGARAHACVCTSKLREAQIHTYTHETQNHPFPSQHTVTYCVLRAQTIIAHHARTHHRPRLHTMTRMYYDYILYACRHTCVHIQTLSINVSPACVYV